MNNRMTISAKLQGKSFDFDIIRAIDISIPLQFNGVQPSSYDVDEATSRAYEDEGFIGDTRRGGGCNFEQITMVPHCNGTHTECIGHITDKRYAVNEQLKDSLIPTTLVSVTPEYAKNSPDRYDPPKENGDMFISRKTLEEALGEVPKMFLKALVIRTLPNDDSKLSRNYMKQQAPFFSLDAMDLIVQFGVEHLLVDLPSVDRAHDGGRLNVHHLFWNVESGSHEANAESMVHKTISEMIYVPEDIEDGSYLLNLQIAPFVSDAAPSRPILYPLIRF